MEIKAYILTSDQGLRCKGLTNTQELDNHVMHAQNVL